MGVVGQFLNSDGVAKVLEGKFGKRLEEATNATVKLTNVVERGTRVAESSMEAAKQLTQAVGKLHAIVDQVAQEWRKKG